MGIFDTIVSGVKDTATGFVKGGLDTGVGLVKQARKAGTALARGSDASKQAKDSLASLEQTNRDLIQQYAKMPATDPKKQQLKGLIEKNFIAIDQIKGQPDKQASYRDNSTFLDKSIVPTNTMQRVGFAGEKITELFAPASKVAKADKALSTVNVFKGGGKIAKAGNSLVRTGAKAALEGIATGATNLAQSAYQGRLDTEAGRKGAFKEAKNTALFSGGLKAGLSGLGALAGAAKIPEKLYGKIYKTDKKELSSILGNFGDDAVDVGKGQKVTVAQWALGQKITGGVKKQAQRVMDILRSTEKELISNAKAKQVRIPIEKDLKNFAIKIKAEYKTSPFKNISQDADEFLRSIGKDGTADVASSLKFKRTLDSLRSKSSFNNTRIGDDLVGWSDILRTKVNGLGGLGEINKNYALALKARDALIKRAVSEQNKPLLGVLDAVALAAGDLTGLGVLAAKAATVSAGVLSRGAQTINNLGSSSPIGIGARALFGKAANNAAFRSGISSLTGGEEGYDIGGQMQQPTPSVAPTPQTPPQYVPQDIPMEQLTPDDLELMRIN